jgi:hypothetical protein
MSNLPLENYFKDKVSKGCSSLSGSHDYVAIYYNILNVLRVKVYPAIDIGLTKSGGVYTLHNKDHFDHVVRKAGELLGISPNACCDLTAYELFVLLLAIRIHDAGNAYGRGGHEKRCEDILIEVYKDFPYKETERMAIALIAQAHGGENPDGDKDVISRLPEIDHIGETHIHSQRIAAIVRLADELAENNTRTPQILLDSGGIPKENEVFHYYAESLHTNALVALEIGNRINLKFLISVEDAKKEFGKLGGTVYLIDEIQTRLIKMNQERVYCNQFLSANEKLESISAKVTIRDSVKNSTVWEDEFLIRDDGYPNYLSPPKCLSNLSSKTVLCKLG